MALTKIDDRGLTTPIDLLDNEKIRFGTGNDLELFHDGSHSYFNNHTGNLSISGALVGFMNAGNSEWTVKSISNGAIELYYDGNLQCSTVDGGMNWADGKRAYFGNSSDLQIYFDGTHSKIIHTPNTGNAYLASDSLILSNVDMSEYYLQGTANGSVELYYNGAKKFETTDTGVRIPDSSRYEVGAGADLLLFHNGTNNYIRSENGTLYIDSSGGEKMITAIPNDKVELYFDDVVRFSTYNSGCIVNGHLYLTSSDSHKLILGEDHDLQIYHSGSHAYIDNGTGDTYVRPDGLFYIIDKTNSEVRFVARDEGSVELYYDNVKKFETSSSGADFSVGTGEVDIYSTGSGDQHSLRLLNSNASAGNKIGIYFGPANNIAGASIQGIAESDFTTTANRDGGLIFTTRQDGNWNERVRIDSSGKVLIGHTASLDAGGIEGSLQITGTDSDNSSLTLSKFGADDWCSFLTFSKSRNATIGNQTACTSNERLGQILWTGSDGTDAANGCAHIVARADGNFSSNNCPTKMEFGVNAGTTSAATYLTIKPNGNVEVNDGNLVVAAGHGIDFSAQVPSSTGTVASGDEVLDHYEHGTFTPNVHANYGTTDVTQPTTRNGTYTRIGSRVFFGLHIAGSFSYSGSTGHNVTIGNLPFTANGNGVHLASLSVWPYSGFSDADNIIARIKTGHPEAYLQRCNPGASVLVSQCNTSNWNLMLNGSYTV